MTERPACQNCKAEPAVIGEVFCWTCKNEMCRKLRTFKFAPENKQEWNGGPMWEQMVKNMEDRA